MKPATPFKVVRDSDKGGFRGISIKNADNLFIANMVGQLDDSEGEQAAYIVHAANSYPKLVEALRKMGAGSPSTVKSVNDGTALLRELGEIK